MILSCCRAGAGPDLEVARQRHGALPTGGGDWPAHLPVNRHGATPAVTAPCRDAGARARARHPSKLIRDSLAQRLAVTE